ncbi:MAG: hypothetical protein KBD78_01465 [Oligoflexales bacterium]|nr:hypothetical protein [Oligoflexales bacterium]
MSHRSKAFFGFFLFILGATPSYSQGSSVSDIKSIKEIVEIPLIFGDSVVLGQLCYPGIDSTDLGVPAPINGVSTIVSPGGQNITVTKKEIDLAVLNNKVRAIDKAKWDCAQEAKRSNLGVKDPTLHHVELVEERPFLLSITCMYSYALESTWELIAARDTQKFRCIDNAIFNLTAVR